MTSYVTNKNTSQKRCIHCGIGMKLYREYSGLLNNPTQVVQCYWECPSCGQREHVPVPRERELRIMIIHKERGVWHH